MQFYVYEWYNTKTNEVFYVGKGCRDRYKQIRKRNKFFLEYYQNNKVDVRIVKYFDDEKEAFEYEQKLTEDYRKKGECACNLIDGGYGGYSSIWNDSAREYYSKYNIMKRPEQRERMSKNNPMKNPEIAKKVSLLNGRKVQIGDKIFLTIKSAAKEYHKSPSTISNWCNKGENPDGLKCFFLKGEEEKGHSSKPKSVVLDGKHYTSISKAAQAINCNPAILARHLKKGKGVYEGHTIEYANQQPS